jgi:hypothetical protein
MHADARLRRLYGVVEAAARGAARSGVFPESLGSACGNGAACEK